MLYRNPYLTVTKELKNKQEYIDSYLNTGMIALISENRVIWLERYNGDYALFRQVKGENLECFRGNEQKNLIFFIHLAEKTKEAKENPSVVEIIPQDSIQRIKGYIHSLTTYFEQYKKKTQQKEVDL